MIASFFHFPSSRRSIAATVLLTLGAGLSLGLGGCADIGDTMTSAFADPAKYEFYECKQLEPERKALANRAAELQGLMAKAETGVGGSVVSELAYRNDYISTRAQSRLADEAWRRNKCHDSPPTATPAPAAAVTPPAKDKPKHSRSGTAIN